MFFYFILQFNYVLSTYSPQHECLNSALPSTSSKNLFVKIKDVESMLAKLKISSH